MIFREKKFLSLSLRKQHKHAGDYLRNLFTNKLALDSHYRQLEKWLGLLPLNETKEDLVDRFHFHMKQASIACNEQSLLVKQFDSLSAVPYLPITIYLENLRSAFNIGSILRTVEAFRLGTVVFSENCPDTYHPKVQKTSMGVAPLVPSRRGDLLSLPKPLIGLETVKGAPSLFDFSFPKTFSLLIGNEEYGLKAETLKAADDYVCIPLVGSKNSLNVAAAFAIAAGIISQQHYNKLS